jgi:perosamine synthetase
MLSLIPSEHWEYSVTDLIRGMCTALPPRAASTMAHIELPGLGLALPVRSARAAIVLALKALSLRPGAWVAVPLYCCPVVLKAIDAAGCRPRFIDVDPDTYCLSAVDLAAKSDQVDAVIAVHMFGNLCDIRAVREAAHGKPVIEDCAQALGSRLNGRFAGSFSDIAVFSFRSGKYLSAGEGGAVYCSNPDIEVRLSELIRDLPVPAKIEECTHVAKTYLRSMLRSQPLWGLIGNRLWRAYAQKVSYKSQAPIVLGQVYESDRHAAVRRLSTLALAIERQRHNADYYSRNLTVDAAMLCTETPGAYFNRLQFPVRFPTSTMRERVTAYLQENGITTATPYKDIAAIATTDYGYTGDCPESELIASTVLVIPCHHALKNTEIERTTSNLNRAWEEVGPARRRAVLACKSSKGARRDDEQVAEPQHFS